jgi:hypothetical protein
MDWYPPLLLHLVALALQLIKVLESHTADHELPSARLDACANNFFSPTWFGFVGKGAALPPPVSQDSHLIIPNAGKEFPSHLLSPFLLNGPSINEVEGS